MKEDHDGEPGLRDTRNSVTEVGRKQGAMRRGRRDNKAQIWSYTKARFKNKTVTKGPY